MLNLVIAPDPIYKVICTPVEQVDDTVRATLTKMTETLRASIRALLVGWFVG